MIKKVAIILITTLALTVNVGASSDGELLLKKNEPSEVKDCFEKLNRATFALNQGLDRTIIKPIAKGYSYLPGPVKTGIKNVTNNVSYFVQIPNQFLQGKFVNGAKDTGRFLINTTVGLFGIFDPAAKIGLKSTAARPRSACHSQRARRSQPRGNQQNDRPRSP